MHLEMSDLSGPEAPHTFHLCSWCDLRLDEVHGANTMWRPGAPPADPEDLVMSVNLKSRMSSFSAFARLHQSNQLELFHTKCFQIIYALKL